MIAHGWKEIIVRINEGCAEISISNQVFDMMLEELKTLQKKKRFVEL